MTSLHTLKHNKDAVGVIAVCALAVGALLCMPNSVAGETQAIRNPVVTRLLHQLDAPRIRTVREFSGVVWVGSDDGLAAFENGQWRRWRVADGLPAKRITAFDMDPASHDLWIGTLGGGLVRFTAGRFDVFNQFNSGLAGDQVFGVALHGGRVYAATNGGVCEFEPTSQSWDLLISRRSDESQSVAVDLWSENGTLLANMSPDETLEWDAAVRKWIPRLASRNPDSVEFGPVSSQPESVQTKPNPSSIAILGPGTRRMSQPGDRYAGSAQTTRNQPDVAAVRVAFNRARGANASAEIVLWQPAPGYARYGWGLLEDDLVGYADKSDLVGLVAHVDDHQRYTAASIAYLGIPAVNVAVKPLDHAELPQQGRWFFQCRQDQPLRHRALLDFVRRQNRNLWLVVECDGKDETSLRTAWTKSYASHYQLENIVYISHADPFIDRLSKIDSSTSPNSLAVFLWGDTEQALQKLRDLAATRLDVLVAGDAQLAGPEVRALAVQKGWGVVAIAPADTSSKCPEELVKSYASQPMPHARSKIPDVLACQTFDGADHLLTAVQSGPPGRAAAANTLRHMEQDIFGERHFEARHGNAAVPMNVLQDGQWRQEVITVSLPTEGSNP